MFLILLLVYLNEIQNYLLANSHIVMLNFNSNNFNFFLLNNINKYHPYIFYLSVFLFIYVFSLYKSLYLKNKLYFNKEIILNYFIIIIKFMFIINSFTLFLGSWWAFQEGSWGGWWNWDASETFGLIILLLSIVFYHYKITFDVFIKYLQFLYLYITLFIFLYYFIQLNFEITSHNFGVRFFFFFNNNLFLIENILLFTVLFILKLKNLITFEYFLIPLFRLFQIKKYLPLKSHFWFITLLLLITFAKPVFFSFLPLFNYFLWNFFLINLFNFELTLTTDQLYFFLIINLFLLYTCVNSWLLFLVYWNLLPIFNITFFNFKAPKLLITLHTLLINFFIFNWLITQFSLILNCSIFQFSEIFIQKNNFYYNFNIILNNYFIENSLLFTTDNVILSFLYFDNIIKFVNNLLFNSFLNNLTLFNFFFLNTNNKTFSIYMEFLFLHNLLFLFIFFIIFFLCINTTRHIKM